MSLESPIQIGPLHLENRLIAASSSATAHIDELKKLNQTAIGAITIKSATLEARGGNPECNWHSDRRLSLNTKGLPGPDSNGTIDMLKELRREKKERQEELKPLILSIAGMQPAEYLQLINKTRASLGNLFDAYELNLSCPNVEGKPIIGYDPKTTDQIVSEILKVHPGIPLGIKLPPFFSETEQRTLTDQIQAHLDQQNLGWKVEFDNQTFFDQDKLIGVSRLVNVLRNRGLQFVTATNTLPNCRLTDAAGRTIINPKSNQGRAGLSGDFLHPISLANVTTLRENLVSDFPIIGTGGVKNRQTAQDFLDAGATAVGIGTALIDQGPSLIQNIFLS